MTDQVIAEVERSMDALARRVQAFDGPHSFFIHYHPSGGWMVSAHFLDISASADAPLEAIQEFERQLRGRERQRDSLAQTLGLEAAE